MWRFIVRRFLTALLVVLGAVTITFFLIRLAPGGPFIQEKSFPEASIQALNRHYGLDRPILVQYASYLGNMVRGDLGPSFQYPNKTVNEIIREAFPVSLELGGIALVFALFLGILAGMVSALRPNSLLDRVSMTLAMSGICVPSFVLGPLLVLVFAVYLGWFSTSGWETPGDRVLPAITLGSAYAAYIARLSRAGMLDILPQDFIRTARAKGLSELRVITCHALKPGLFPVVSFLGPAAAGLITGSFVVETVFNIPGLGKMFVASALNRDYTLILGLVAFYAALVAVFNTAVDIVLAILNPKLRLIGNQPQP